MEKYKAPLLDRAELAKYLGLVGRAEMAEKAGVTPAAIDKWRDRHEDFPAPLAELSTGPVWSWKDVEPWIKAQLGKRPGRPKKDR